MDILKQELSNHVIGELRAAQGQLRQDVQQELHVLVEQLKTCLESVHTDVISQLGRFQADLRHMETNFATKQTELQVRFDVDQTQGCVATEQLHDAMSTLEQRIASDMREFKTMLADPLPKPPEGVFLTQDYPAPPGQEQKAYEFRLFRACLTYVYALWDPKYDNSGVGQDGDALEEAKMKFPDLDEKAIVLALEHFHDQVFNRPLS